MFYTFYFFVYTTNMDYKILNLKINSPAVDEAIANFLIELEVCRLEGVKVIKVIHGYGSHGKGGDICRGFRKLCFSLKKQKQIKDFMLGNEWDLANEKCFKLITGLKDCYNDEDINHSNPGITIVIL